VLDSFKTIDARVSQVTANLNLYRHAVGRLHNRAVFEIPDILESILTAPPRVGIDLIQHFRAAERLHLS
jgi:hypothetical protein